MKTNVLVVLVLSGCLFGGGEQRKESGLGATSQLLEKCVFGEGEESEDACGTVESNDDTGILSSYREGIKKKADQARKRRGSETRQLLTEACKPPPTKCEHAFGKCLPAPDDPEGGPAYITMTTPDGKKQKFCFANCEKCHTTTMLCVEGCGD